MDLIEDIVVAPRFTRWVRALMLVGAEGASLGFAIGASAVSSQLLQYVAHNRNTNGIRQTIISSILLCTAALPTVLLASCMLSRAAGKRLQTFEARTRILSPMCAIGFVPLLFQPELWKDKTLGFLLTTALFSVVVTLSSGVTLRVASEITGARWLSDVTAVLKLLRFRGAPKARQTLAIGSILLLGLYGLITSFSATKAPLPASNTEWALITKFSGYHDWSLWFTGIGTRAIGHVSILGAIYSVWGLLWPRPEGLLWLRLLAVSWPALPLFLWARRSVGARAAWFMAASYLSLPLPAMLSANDTFPISFSVGFFFLAGYYFETKRLARGLFAALIAVALHEQAALWFVTLGLFFAARRSKPHWGAWLAAAALLYFGYSEFILLPNAGVAAYSSSTNAVATAAHSLASSEESHALSLLNVAYAIPRWLDNQNLEFWFVLLLPLGFLPLRNSYWFACLLPAVVWSFLSHSACDWHTSAYTHFSTLAFVSCMLTLTRLMQSQGAPRQHRAAALAGWLAALFPCVIMFGTCWLPIQR